MWIGPGLRSDAENWVFASDVGARGGMLNMSWCMYSICEEVRNLRRAQALLAKSEANGEPG